MVKAVRCCDDEKTVNQYFQYLSKYLVKGDKITIFYYRMATTSISVTMPREPLTVGCHSGAHGINSEHRTRVFFSWQERERTRALIKTRYKIK